MTRPGLLARRLLTLAPLALLAACATDAGSPEAPRVVLGPGAAAAIATSGAGLAEQCAAMAQVAADPDQPETTRGQAAQAMGMLGCPR